MRKFDFNTFLLYLECNRKNNSKVIGKLKAYLTETIQAQKEGATASAIITYPIKPAFYELDTVGFCCLDGRLKRKDFKEFQGISEGFDFFYQYEQYDFGKLDIALLLRLNTYQKKRISQNESVKRQIRQIIARALNDENNIEKCDRESLINLLTEYFC